MVKSPWRPWSESRSNKCRSRLVTWSEKRETNQLTLMEESWITQYTLFTDTGTNNTKKNPQHSQIIQRERGKSAHDVSTEWLRTERCQAAKTLGGEAARLSHLSALPSLAGLPRVFSPPSWTPLFTVRRLQWEPGPDRTLPIWKTLTRAHHQALFLLLNKTEDPRPAPG